MTDKNLDNASAFEVEPLVHTAFAGEVVRSGTVDRPMFTPGPWSVRPGFSGTTLIRGALDESIAVMHVVRNSRRQIQRDANAQLIAAAPALYEALKAAEEELRLLRMKDTGAVYNPLLRTQITLAFAKAEGLTTERRAVSQVNTSNTDTSPTKTATKERDTSDV